VGFYSPPWPENFDLASRGAELVDERFPFATFMALEK
jgi:hypothetical protein